MGLHLTGVMQVEAFNGLARSAAGALVAGLWQGMLLCTAAGLILNLLPKTTATLRFLVWVAVFSLSVAMPFANLPASALAGRIEGATSPVMLDLRWSYVLAGLWICVAAYRLGQLGMHAFGLRTLWIGAVPIPSETLLALNVPLIASGHSVELCMSDEVDRPSVIGFFAPRILIPSWLLEQITAMELNHIVLHELEHLRRRDEWVNLLQKIGLVLLPLNPALFWIDHRLSTERELACDDGVLETTKTPRAYAASLASIAERRMDARRHSRFGSLALAVTGLRRRRSELGERIESILGHRTPMNRVVAGTMAATLVAGVVGAAAGLIHAPRLVGFGPDVAGRQAALRSTTMPLESASTSAGSLVGAPKLQDVSFRGPVKVRVKRANATVRRPIPVERARQVSQILPSPPKQFVMLTSWEDSPVKRVVVQTPDGRFFLAPYAAVPTQAGWLIVQL